MQIRQYLIITLFLVSQTAKAQDVTYNHDKSVLNQSTVQEVGSGSLTPDLYYDTLHKKYRNSASETNKLSYRTMTMAYLKKQESYSKTIDTILAKRAEVEALNLLDRQVDAVYMAEKSKLNNALAEFKSNIEKITLKGGSVTVYEDWLSQYEMILEGIDYLHNSYTPNSNRQAQYIETYKDIKKRNERLEKQLRIMTLASRRTSIGENHHTLADRRKALNSLTRWKAAAMEVTGKK